MSRLATSPPTAREPNRVAATHEGVRRRQVASVEVVDEGVRRVFLDGGEVSPGAAAAGR